MDILIADDERIIREGLAHALDWSAMSCRLAGIASDGAEALDMFRKLQPDCVITDIRMPRMNGLELVEAIQVLDPDCRFVILSGHDEFEFARRAMRFGVKYYLLKPFDEDELAEIICRIREEKRPTFEASTGNADVDAILVYLEGHFRKRDLSISWISENLVFMNPDYLGRLFHQYAGQSFRARLTEIRIAKAKILLEENADITLPQLADAVGFPPDGSYLSCQFKKVCGMTISEFRRIRTTDKIV